MSKFNIVCNDLFGKFTIQQRGAQTSAFFQFSLLLFFFLFFLFVQTNSIRLFIFQTIPLGRF